MPIMRPKERAVTRRAAGRPFCYCRVIRIARFPGYMGLEHAMNFCVVGYSV